MKFFIKFSIFLASGFLLLGCLSPVLAADCVGKFKRILPYSSKTCCEGLLEKFVADDFGGYSICVECEADSDCTAGACIDNECVVPQEATNVAPTAEKQAVCDPKSCEIGGLFKDVSGECVCCGDCILDDFLLIGRNIFNYILGIVGSLMLLMFIFGGFFLLISGGSSEKIEKGKKYLVNAVIGGIIVFVAFTVVNFLINQTVKEEYKTTVKDVGIEIKK